MEMNQRMELQLSVVSCADAVFTANCNCHCQLSLRTALKISFAFGLFSPAAVVGVDVGRADALAVLQVADGADDDAVAGLQAGDDLDALDAARGRLGVDAFASRPSRTT